MAEYKLNLIYMILRAVLTIDKVLYGGAMTKMCRILYFIDMNVVDFEFGFDQIREGPL